MAEPGSREPAGAMTSVNNLTRIEQEGNRRWRAPEYRANVDITNRLRDEVRGLGGGFESFRRGGRVHRTGVYKLHRGERVIPARGRRRGRR